MIYFKNAVASGFVGAYDAIPSIAAAYGMRRLRSAYTGSILRLRRDSDDSESDFGYTAAGDIDTGVISTWLGAASGYVMTWYDQSGNGYDAAQATTASQPLYVTSGQNGKPGIDFNGSTQYLVIPQLIAGATPGYVLAVASLSTTADAVYRTIIYGQDSIGIWSTTADGGKWGTYEGAPVTYGTLTKDITYLLEIITRGYNDIDLFQNATKLTKINGVKWHAAVGYGIGGRPNQYHQGGILEVIGISSILSTTDRQAAEAAANAYWAIY